MAWQQRLKQSSPTIVQRSLMQLSQWRLRLPKQKTRKSKAVYWSSRACRCRKAYRAMKQRSSIRGQMYRLSYQLRLHLDQRISQTGRWQSKQQIQH